MLAHSDRFLEETLLISIAENSVPTPSIMDGRAEQTSMGGHLCSTPVPSALTHVLPL